MIQDSALLREYAANHTEDAFAELVRRHLGLVYSAAMRRTGGDLHQTQDIVQFVFNDLARKANAVARHPTLAGWLHTATRNAAINATRAERRRRYYEKEASTMNETLSATAHDAEWNRVRPVLDEVIDHLPQPDHDAVVLRFLEGRPFAEIGQALRISEDAARMRVDRATEKLRRLLARRGITSSAAALSFGLAGHTALAAPGGMAAAVTGTALAQATPGVVAAWWTTVTTGTKLLLGTAGVALLLTAGLAIFGGQTRVVESAHSPALLPAGTIASAPRMPASLPISFPPTAVSDSPEGRIATIPQGAPRRPAPVDQRARMARLYASLFDRLALEPARREQLLTLLVDEFEVAADFAAASSAAGTDATADAAGFDVSVRQLREEIWSRIRTLLGEEGYAEYLAARQNLRADSWVSGLAKNLEATGTPLGPDQIQRFRALLQESGREPNDPATLVEASLFLSPAQMAALRELHAERVAGAQSPKVQAAAREAAAKDSRNP